MSLYSELHDQWVDSEIWDFSLWLVAEIERLRGELEVALANRQAFQDDMLSANSRLADENSRLRAELAAAKAEPPRPAAIVVHRHRATSKGFHLHLFEDDRDAVKYSVGLIDERVLPHDVRKIDEVTWHPKLP